MNLDCSYETEKLTVSSTTVASQEGFRYVPLFFFCSDYITVRRDNQDSGNLCVTTSCIYCFSVAKDL